MISVMDSVHTALVSLGLFGISIGVVSAVAYGVGVSEEYVFEDIRRSGVPSAIVDSLWFSIPSTLLALAACICGQVFVKTQALPNSVLSYGIALLAAFVCYITALVSGFSLMFILEAMFKLLKIEQNSVCTFMAVMVAIVMTRFFLEITKASIIWSFI
jgi:hypothetical protein